MTPSRAIAIAWRGLLGALAALGCSEVTPPNRGITVTAVSPATDLLPGGTTVTISGGNFIDVTAVTIGGSEIGARMVVGPTLITGTTPPSTVSGATDVVVASRSHGRGTCSNCFRYDLGPAPPPPGPILAAGSSHTCVVTSSGAAYCWGMGIANGSPANSSSPVAVRGGVVFSSLTAGGRHTCGLTSAGVAWCWGYNPAGELGNSSTTDSWIPVVVAGDMKFSVLAAGGGVPGRGGNSGHSCGITSSHAAYCWGDNRYGELGTDSPGSSLTPVAVSGALDARAIVAGPHHTCALTDSGVAYCWGDSRSWAPVAVEGGITFRAIAAGGHSASGLPIYWRHTCGLDNAGAAYCWGNNTVGQLGDGTTSYDSIPAAVSGNLAFVILAPGGLHTCGLTRSGTAYCWGSNEFGQLGTGSTTGPEWCGPSGAVRACSRTPVAVSGDLRFTQIASGSFHTCGLTDGGAAYCWGFNLTGQLGNGSTDDSPIPVPVSWQTKMW